MTLCLSLATFSLFINYLLLKCLFFGIPFPSIWKSLTPFLLLADHRLYSENGRNIINICPLDTSDQTTKEAGFVLNWQKQSKAKYGWSQENQPL